MAASVRIEDEAFSDRRYDRLAAMCGLVDADHARGKMAVLWRQCTLEQRYVLPVEDVVAVLGENAVQGLTSARLGSKVRHGLRIAGTKGRIEWLKKLRENGAKGGRPRKPKGLASGSTELNPPAPAPAPAPAPESPSEIPKEKDRPAKRAPFVPPTVAEVAAYVETRTVKIDPQRFVDYYSANGWVQGRGGKPVRDWQACVRTWEGNNFGASTNGTATASTSRRTGTASFDPARHKLTPIAGHGGTGPQGEGEGV